VAIPNARQPAPGLLTGGQPTRDQVMQAAAAGYKTVVCLREATEPGAWDPSVIANGLHGMKFVRLPFTGPHDLNEENAAALERVLGDPEALPAVVHCGSGNRVGALLAVRASLFHGASVDQALELGRRAGLVGLEPATRAFIQQHLDAGECDGQTSPD
jgi:protein tyrosine phosphatase (PTP) superfamily phosphohydrolase (DUF442 family)